jgi:transposase-like protein
MAMTLAQIYKKYPTRKACITHLEKVRWKNNIICPYCGSNKASHIPGEQRHHCNTCNTTYSVTVKTIFHNKKIDLQKWLLGISLVLDSEEVSVRRFAQILEIDKNTAWFMRKKIKQAILANRNFLRDITAQIL